MAVLPAVGSDAVAVRASGAVVCTAGLMAFTAEDGGKPLKEESWASRRRKRRELPSPVVTPVSFRYCPTLPGSCATV